MTRSGLIPEYAAPARSESRQSLEGSAFLGRAWERGSRLHFSPPLPILAAALALMAAASAAIAEAPSTTTGRYFPLDQTAPPGVAAFWSTVGRDYVPVMQPVRIELPAGGGKVSFFCVRSFTETPEPATLTAPATAALRVGSIYRLKVSGLRDYPGMEFYPTVELIDRLHPPRGREVEFAVPIPFTDEEFAFALEGRLITKVIYLEQPERAIPVRNPAARNQLAGPRENVLALADEAGRPMVIVRLGGRVPDAAAPEPGFYGTGAPIQFFEQAAVGRETVR